MYGLAFAADGACIPVWHVLCSFAPGTPWRTYHVTARSNERKAIFRDDFDRFHLRELRSELDERFGTKTHAFVLERVARVKP